MLTNPTINAQDRALLMDSMLTELADGNHFSGVLLVAEGDKILLEKAYGLADRGEKSPLTTNSMFELASVSKQFTAAAIMQLHLAEKLNLDAPAAAYLPQLKHYPEVTVRQLVHHTGGLPDYMDMAMIASQEADDKIMTNADVLELLESKKVAADFAPGERHQYSNTGYLVLASIVEKVSGQTFGDYLTANIFQPLGMKRTRIYRRRYQPETIKDYALGYIYTATDYVLPDDYEDTQMVVNLDGIVGDGMVNSTVGDLYRWDRALKNNTLFDAATTKILFTPGKTDSGESTDYAFGWATGEIPGVGPILQHGGGWPGYITMIERHLDQDKVIILLRNDAGGDEERLDPYSNIRQILYNAPTKELAAAPEGKLLNAAEAAPYLGVYAISPDFKLEMLMIDGKMHTQATGQSAFPIFQAEGHKFFLKVVEAELIFQANEVGEITGATLYQGGQEVPAKKE